MVPEHGREPFDGRRVVPDACCKGCDALPLKLLRHRLELVAVFGGQHPLVLEERLVVVEEHGLELVRNSVELVLVAPEVYRPAEELVVPPVLFGILVELGEQVRVDVLPRESGPGRHDDVGSLATLQSRPDKPVHLVQGLESDLEVRALVRFLEGLLYALLEVGLRPRSFEVAPVRDLAAAASSAPAARQERAPKSYPEGSRTAFARNCLREICACMPSSLSNVGAYTEGYRVCPRFGYDKTRLAGRRLCSFPSRQYTLPCERFLCFHLFRLHTKPRGSLNHCLHVLNCCKKQ